MPPAHGHAVSLFLPFFMDYHQKVTEETCRDSRGVNWIRGIMNNLSEILNVETEELGMETACFINRCNLSIDYEELNITEQQFMQAIGSLNEERLKNNPVLVDNKILSQLYRSTFNCNEC